MAEKAGALLPSAGQDVAPVHCKRRLFKSLLPSVIVLALLSRFRAPFWHTVTDASRYMTLEQKEQLFLSVPNPESALTASRQYATHPHQAGSPEDFEDAKSMLSLFQREFNILRPETAPIFPAGSPESRNSTLLLTTRTAPINPTAWIDVYYPVMSIPLNRSLDILGVEGQVIWSADLEEDGDPLDKDAHRYKDAVPAWHGFSRDGDVVGQVVFANYGTEEDYNNLETMGTNLTGKIVLARYGSVYRGLKIKSAEERGAVGVIIYSDPRDDGYVTVANGYAPYPHGPARNPTSVQRGNVHFLSIYPGDPTTPGYPSYEDVERQEGTNIPKIPSLPISWNNAQRLLQEIGDLYSDERDSRGFRRLTGKASVNKVRLVNHVDTRVTPIWNTMAAIPGHIRDEIVVIGCHRDAWVMGAADPVSGTVSVHEIVRGFGALLRGGWKPLRTVMFASWDAEEHGLIGSTEWGEDFASWIPGHVVAYLNVDVSVSGSRFSLYGSPSLAHLLRRSAIDIPHPTKPGKTLWDAREDKGPFTMGTEIDEEYTNANSQVENIKWSSDTGVLPLGSGSDFTVFLQRLGVASTDEGFKFTSTDAVYHYHSVYDTQLWQELYGDKGFHRHVAVAKHLGLVGLRIIDSIVLPLNTTQYALELDQYLNKVEDLSKELSISVTFEKLRKSIRKLQKGSAELDQEKTKAEKKLRKLLHKFLGNRHTWYCHKFTTQIRRLLGMSHDAVTTTETVSLENDIHRIWDYQYSEENVNRGSGSGPSTFDGSFHSRKLIKAAKRVHDVNAKLIAFEQGFISEDGIKDREWYRHLGVAPGKWLGYGATTFPALTESLAIEKNASLAQQEVDRLAKLLSKLSHVIHP
ncbi:hypothetical protein AX15_002295 [Amanita polypyramis BW_CC]|nr:hypothetical protein AX15_002295 [Amanita polypyramis BW_CC]